MLLRRVMQVLKIGQIIDSSALAKDIVNARYKEGLSTYIEALDVTTTYLNAQLALLEARYNINNIINRLEYLRGNAE